MVTVFSNLFSRNPKYVNEVDVFKAISTGSKQKDLIKQVRVEVDKTARNELKKQLGVILWSGKFSERRVSGLLEYSHLICLDFDDVDPSEAKEYLKSVPYVYACFESPSGVGCKAIIKVSSRNHEGHFKALSKELDGVDPSGKDVSRACFMSYDPHIYVNPHAEIYTKIVESVYTDQQRYDKLKAWLSNKGEYFVNGNRNTFLAKLSGACNRFGIGYDFTFEAIKRDFLSTDADFPVREAEGVLKSIYSNYSDQFDTASFDEAIDEQKFIDEILSVEVQARDIIRVEDVKVDIIRDFEEGTQKGLTTYFPTLDNHFRFLKGEITTLTGLPNMGKALAVDTPIPTINGWKTMGEIQVGDVVFDECGKPCNVTFITDYQYDRKCYRIEFSDGSHVVADADHLWFTETRGSLRSELSSKKNGRDTGRPLKLRGSDQSHKKILPSVKTTQQIVDTLKEGGRPNHSIRTCKPVQYPEQKLPVSPYILGYWLGDGTSDSNSFTISDDDAPVVTELFKEEGYVLNKLNSKLRYSILGIYREFRLTNLIKNKHIPEKYLIGSVDQRIALLQGLMDSDGSIDKNGICEFSNTNKGLAYSVYELLTSLGIKSSITESDAKIYGRVVSKKYRIVFVPFINVFRLPRKAERIREYKRGKRRYITNCVEVDSVPVKCIQVDSPNKLYLCTKSYIPTHNTTMLAQLLVFRAAFAGEKFAFLSMEQYPPTFFYKELVRTIIGKPIEKHFSDRMTLAEFNRGLEWVNDHFFFIYPERDEPTPEWTLARFYESIVKYGVNGCVVDPYNSQSHDFASAKGRDDRYIAAMLNKAQRFALTNDVYYFTVAHPRNIGKNEKGYYKEPTPDEISGGGAWYQRNDNILIFHRPYMPIDYRDPLCTLRSAKIKKQMICGKPGVVDFMYDDKIGRFFENGYNPLTKFTL
jgi:hypothetical protein